VRRYRDAFRVDRRRSDGVVKTLCIVENTSSLSQSIRPTVPYWSAVDDLTSLPPLVSRYNAGMKRPRFSLRTLLIATALLGAMMGTMAYYVRWKYERQIAREWFGTHLVGGTLWGFSTHPRPRLPWGLVLLGEQPLDNPHFVSANEHGSDLTEYHRRVAEIVDLFPEAEIIDLDREPEP
jgi:hypothetical protein